eukprot:m.111185 g.111185  ORF g.111185 m.111185 type:complete len:185 (+) comp51818_c0_seq17:1204-1758(+)
MVDSYRRFSQSIRSAQPRPPCTLLLAARRRIFRRLSRGNTALHWAVSNNHVEVLEWFVELRIDCNGMRDDGWTALMVAALKGSTECARILLQAGARTTITNREGHTALALAQVRQSNPVIQLLEEHERCLEAQQYIKPAVREHSLSEVDTAHQQQETAHQSLSINLLDREPDHLNAPTKQVETY